MSSEMLIQLVVILLFLLVNACSFESDCECQTFSTKRFTKRSATCREKYTIKIIEGWILPSDNACHFLNPDIYSQSTNVTDELRTRCNGLHDCFMQDIVAIRCYICTLNVNLCCVLKDITTNSGQTTQNLTSLFTSENKIKTALPETKSAIFSIFTPRTQSIAALTSKVITTDNPRSHKTALTSTVITKYIPRSHMTTSTSKVKTTDISKSHKIALTSKFSTKDIPSVNKNALTSKDITKDITISYKSTLTSKAITKDISRFHNATLVTSAQNNSSITNTSKSTSRKSTRNSYHTTLSPSTAVPYYTTVSRTNQPIKSTAVGTTIGVAIGAVSLIPIIVVLLTGGCI